jgi:DNA-binding NtrC family response regulator
MKRRILFVDDEQCVLDTYRRSLRDKFDVDLVLSGEQGLDAMRATGPYAAVISDFRMPGMDGISFLSRAREISPETLRVILTGVAGIPNAVQAVKDGDVYCFLAKPCPANVLSELLTLVLCLDCSFPFQV